MGGGRVNRALPQMVPAAVLQGEVQVLQRASIPGWTCNQAGLTLVLWSRNIRGAGETAGIQGGD